jgi:chromosomal replication initiator protein
VSTQLQLEDEEVSITLRRAWDRALRSLATRVNKATFEGHMRKLRPLALTEDGEVTLGVPSAFVREWVETRHATLIKSLLEEILDKDIRLRFVLTPRPKSETTGAQPGLPLAPPEETPKEEAPEVAPTPAPGATQVGGLFQLTPEDAAGAPQALPQTASRQHGANAPSGAYRRPNTQHPAPPPPPAAAQARVPTAPRKSGESGPSRDAPLLNEHYTFDTFVVGPSNRLAQAGARAVAQAPGRVYNPLFLYGPSGLGKTHLMHAIGNESANNGGSPAGRIAYISGESFTSHYITSLREHRADEFRRRWRSVDLWLVDDIQFIAGKEHTKEEFFHTFNALYQTGKQIVISSDRSPRELHAMDERLRSRFESGLIADIAPPDLETRLAILHQKAETEQMRIPDDVLLYMARLVQSNIRTLEGALVKLIAYASVVNSPVTTQLAADILGRYYIAAGGAGDGGHGAGDPSFPPPGAVTPEAVQRVVAKKFGLSPDALVGKKRDHNVAQARQLAMHLTRELTEVSLPGIGQFFGGRTHSTVAHACERVRSQLESDDELQALIQDLIAQVRAQITA